MALSISCHKEIFNGNLVHNIWMPVFMKFKYRKKTRVNKVIKQIALIEDACNAYVFFAITIWKHSFANFLNIFYSFQCLYIVPFEWDILLSSSYDGWHKCGYTIWCPREGTTTLINYVWL